MKKLMNVVAAILLLSASMVAQLEVPNPIPNDTVTGSTQNKLVKYNTTSSATSVIITATTDTKGAIGVCADGCGTSGKAAVITLGGASLVIDNTAVPNDYVTISSTVAGDGHDFGSSCPTNGAQVVGTIFGAGGSAGTYTVHIQNGLCPPSTTPAPICSAVGSSDTISAAGVFATVCPITAANISGAGQIIEIRAHGVYTTTGTSTPIEHMRVNAFGTTGVCQYSGGNNALNISLTNLSWDVLCYVQILTTGAPGTATAWGTDNVAATIAGGVVSKNFSQNAATVSATTNSTNNVTIEETATLVTGQSFTLQTLFVRNY
jgi:hypothetical protein